MQESALLLRWGSYRRACSVRVLIVYYLLTEIALHLLSKESKESSFPLSEDTAVIFADVSDLAGE